MPVPLKSPDEIDAIGRAGRSLWSALQQVIAFVAVGRTSREVEAFARRTLLLAGLEPVLQGYQPGDAPPFPGAACVCINEEAVHSIPSDRIIREGDIVTVDLSGRCDGWCADAAGSTVVGPDLHGRTSLLQATRRVLEECISLMAPGRRWSDVMARGAGVAAESGFTLVAGYDGHGIGRELHEAPRAALASRTGQSLADFVLRPGMVLTVEPVLTAGGGDVVTLDDGWTVVSADRAPVCHEERTVAITRSGVRVLTGLDFV